MASGAVGFIGLGTMGGPIALNLLRSGLPLLVWNRNRDRAEPLREAGAGVADDVGDLFARSSVVVLMLSSGDAIDEVLLRGRGGFADLVAGHLVVNMGTTSPSYSRRLASDLRAAGARYVEAPVSGTKVRAENRELVGLLAGHASDLDEARSIVSPACGDLIVFGDVPTATDAKFALSVYQGTMMIALVEAVYYARRGNVELKAFSELLRSGPLCSSLMELQLAKLVEKNYSVQMSISTVYAVVRTIVDEATSNGASLPMLTRSTEIYESAIETGAGEQDVTSVLRTYERAAGAL